MEEKWLTYKKIKHELPVSTLDSKQQNLTMAKLSRETNKQEGKQEKQTDRKEGCIQECSYSSQERLLEVPFQASWTFSVIIGVQNPTDAIYNGHHIPETFTTRINPKLIPAFASLSLNSAFWTEESC